LDGLIVEWKPVKMAGDSNAGVLIVVGMAPGADTSRAPEMLEICRRFLATEVELRKRTSDPKSASDTTCLATAAPVVDPD
jgi:hypothetical protein